MTLHSAMASRADRTRAARYARDFQRHPVATITEAEIDAFEALNAAQFDLLLRETFHTRGEGPQPGLRVILAWFTSAGLHALTNCWALSPEAGCYLTHQTGYGVPIVNAQVLHVDPRRRPAPTDGIVVGREDRND